MPRPIRAGGLVLLLLLVGCTAVAPPSGAGSTSAAGPDTTDAAAPATALPGDEVLTAPPLDSAAPDRSEVLRMLPGGTWTAHASLVLAGLASFDEQVVGTCEPGTGAATFTTRLQDGSSWSLVFGDDRATSELEAPGVRVIQQLTSVDLVADVDTGEWSVTADLVSDGTSEVSGSLDVAGGCR